MLAVSLFTVFLDSIPRTQEDEFCFLVPPCNFSPLRTDAISVPGIVQHVLLHKRFPRWCCPVIFLRVYNITWRYGVLHNTLHLRGLTASCVSTHTARLWCFSAPKAASTNGAKLKKEPFAFSHQVLPEYFKCKDIWDELIWQQRKNPEQHPKAIRKKKWDVKTQVAAKGQISQLDSVNFLIFNEN